MKLSNENFDTINFNIHFGLWICTIHYFIFAFDLVHVMYFYIHAHLKECMRNFITRLCTNVMIQYLWMHKYNIGVKLKRNSSKM